MGRKVSNFKYIKILIPIFFVLILFLISVVIRSPKENENYLNSDATYHILLIVKALSDNPVKTHYFLPIVTLSNSEDKHVSWGATVPDEYGNYYYTSFMPLSFVVPYLWFKTTRLEINEFNLYLFSSILGLLSLISVNILFIKIFYKKLPKHTLILITSLFYMFSPELMHTHGLVYWGQSLFQLIMILQLISFISLTQKNNKLNFIIFVFICILSPMVEWTGYISNLGYIILILLNHFIKKKLFTLDTFKTTLIILISNLLALSLFFFHFLLKINQDDFTSAIKNRFLARNITSPISLKYLLDGYSYSFKYFLVVSLVSAIVLLILKKIKSNIRLKTFITPIILFTIPLIENLIMKEHAIIYTYDRSKAIFIIIFLPLICLYYVKKINKKIAKNISILFIVITFLMSLFYLFNYAHKDNLYRWKDYDLTGNTVMAKYVNTFFTPDNSVLAQDYLVRGYSNLLFNRSIIEVTTIDNALLITEQRRKKYLVYFTPIRKQWQKDIYKTAIIYNLTQKSKKHISVMENLISESEWLSI